MAVTPPKYIFNFNKSCIWIEITKLEANVEKDLTLTRVVFESKEIEEAEGEEYDLTLTRVVFELGIVAGYLVFTENLTLTRVVFECIIPIWFKISICYLTLTRVVFEYGRDSTWRYFWPKFNFNKSCIWILP